LASGTQSFAAQDIFNPGASAEWRLLNPACDRSSEFYAQAEVLLTQAPVIFSRGMTKADLHNIKKRLVLPMLESPCNPKRYMPHGVPPSDEPFFSTALVNAQTVVCKQENRLELSDESVSKYKKKLYQLDYRTSGIERYHPPQTARMVGIEHTFTFSLNLIWGFDMKECSHEDPAQDDYWCWSKTLANLAVSETVTVVTPPDQEACMSDGSDVEATSVTAELRQIASLSSFAWEEKLTNMANELDVVWENVHSENGERDNLLANFSFVLGRKDMEGYCQTSTTWV